MRIESAPRLRETSFMPVTLWPSLRDNLVIRVLGAVGRPVRIVPFVLLTLGLVTDRVPAADPVPPVGFPELRQRFAGPVQKTLAKFCLDCHGETTPDGDLNLVRFSDLSAVRRDPAAWIKVAEMLDLGEMPPKKADQPTAEQKKELRDWIRDYLRAEAYAGAGDPGPVVMRRLSNAEYTFTIHDLTGVPLSPASEFPADSAAGEGFTNAGAATVMSPALLTKYLDAAKGIAEHAVLLPDGFRFSAGDTKSDHTNELVQRIKEFYSRYTDSEGATRVNLQGIIFDTNGGGRIPIDRYLRATVVHRDALRSGAVSVSEIASREKLNEKYLSGLWNLLSARERSPLIDPLRKRWNAAGEKDVPSLVEFVHRWQGALTRFQTVGHMRPWVVAVNPLTTRQEIRLKLAPPEGAAEVPFRIQIRPTAGSDANAGTVTLAQPRLSIPGRGDLALADVPAYLARVEAQREMLFESAAEALTAAAEAARSTGPVDVAALAATNRIDPEVLATWFRYLGIGGEAALKLDHLTNRIERAQQYDFVRGWGSDATPLVLANSSDQDVRIPGRMAGHAVTVHPSPTLNVSVGWRAPVAGEFRIESRATHAHPECGNGVTWSLELRRGALRQRLAAGIAHGNAPQAGGPIERFAIQAGDLVSLVIGPRDGNHSCDLTDVELAIRGIGQDSRQWVLTRDVTPDVLAGNPHADGAGHGGVWHFYTEPVAATAQAPVIPPGSLLGRWQGETDPAKRAELAQAVETLLKSTQPAGLAPADEQLYRQLSSVGGPLLSTVGFSDLARKEATTDRTCPADKPHHETVTFPADLVRNAEFVTTATVTAAGTSGASVQIDAAAVADARPDELWPDVPILVTEGGLQTQYVQGFDAFRRWFPVVACYTKIVPVDEVITLTLFHREDAPLVDLMLGDQERAELDRLWGELRFVSGDALTSVDAFLQLLEYASQDGDPKMFEPLRKPINDRADAYRAARLAAEPRQLEALGRFASQAFRRLDNGRDRDAVAALYRALRDEGLPHDEAFRLTLARLLVSPAFLYRLESSPEGNQPAPVNGTELASRLSYFLWASAPDDELLRASPQGLASDDEILRQTRRMIGDPRARRLASEFACQWLHIYDFATLDEKSETHFPTFAGLRDDLQEEAIVFFADWIRRDGSILELLTADHLFVNAPLAEHYAIPGVAGEEWRRVDEAARFGRGGILGLGATLAKQSGASRTSPILRGNWVSEVLLGEKLPKPPKDVPQLPEEEGSDQLTMRQITERHTSDVRCSGCHVRIDPLGFSLEAFDAIGRRREKDAAGRVIDTGAKLVDGTEFAGLDGLRNYLVNTRREAFVRQFCRKLLGYALGRGVQLSDEPLLDAMHADLQANGYRVSRAIELIVGSRQFREIRGRAYQGIATTDE
ncbi:hypothetical protein VT03_04640 [Planctomyces sp. SH-PL14]|nr:hypothetical protein VT03_04640 [Planctomyces sp. SH-PL14]